jgi:threonylcarbamoyladenosine tRNA methylthiotransferase MtaB
MPTVAIETHGCKLNQADSQALAREFHQAGYRLVNPDQPADVYVLDTCTVTHVADRKARHALRAARRRNPLSIIVATGCYAQRSPADLKALEGVDMVLGNRDKPRLVREVVSLYEAAPSPLGTGNTLAVIEEGAENGWHIENGAHRTRAMVKIQEGCNQVCAYCIVPSVRGRERSIPAGELVEQVLALEEEGFQEVVLTGTQLGSYGFEIPGASLERLLELILNRTTISRIRVSSLQPQEMGDVLLQLWDDPRLCPHFHMPLQSGSNTVLRRMRRRYTADRFARAVKNVRGVVSGTSITTDVVTGFPGETEEEFQETYRFCEEVGFSSMHVFPYSVRPGTAAASHGDRVSPQVKGHRVELLLELAQEHARRFRRSLIGQVRPVLWEGRVWHDGSRLWSGLTDNYVRVLVDDPRSLGNTVTDTLYVGELNGSLHGRVV